MGSVIVDQRDQAKIIFPAVAAIAGTFKQRQHEGGNRALDRDLVAMRGLVNVESCHALGKNQFRASFQNRVEQSLLGGEIIMRKRGIKVSQNRHLAHRDAIKAALRKKVFCGVENPISCIDIASRFTWPTYRGALWLWLRLRPATRPRGLAVVTAYLHVWSRMDIQTTVARCCYCFHKLLNLNFFYCNSFHAHS